MPERKLSRRQVLFQKYSYRLLQSAKLPKGAVAPFLRSLGMRGFYPATIVDIGANRGRWTEKAITVFSESSYVLVEPQIEMKAELDKLCARHPRVRWINAGVAAVDGELPFTLTGRTSSTFALSAEVAKERGFAQRSVPVMTLDRLCSEVVGAVPEIVKIDAEGFEFEILKGGTSVLGKVEVFLLELPFFEYIARPGALLFRDAVVQMSQYGYEVYDFTAFQKRRYDGALGQCEIAFARRDGILRAYKDWA